MHHAESRGRLRRSADTSRCPMRSGQNRRLPSSGKKSRTMASQTTIKGERMLNPTLFFTAAGVGLAVAAPVGPMGMLCIRRTLTDGPRAGLAIGFGIASGDAIYGLIAALGLVGVSHFMLAYDNPLHIIAGLFLLYLGIRTMLQKVPADTGNSNGGDNA